MGIPIKHFICAFIFARGGSKGIPRKNIKLLGDKPLIAYAIETGLNSRYINRVAVSTDDQEIAEVARRYGADVPFMRPKYLAQDDSPELLAWRHAVTEIEKTSEQLKVKNIMLYPYAHLSSDLASPKRAQEILVETEYELRNKNFNVKRSPFGWYKAFKISCKGHPLSELSREIIPEKETKDPQIELI